MNQRLRFPIRLKILVTLLLVVTGVVSAITLTMASLFHEDKKAYINDLVSLVAISTAEECRSTLIGYGERLQVYARIVGDRELSRRQKVRLVEGIFIDFPELIGVAVSREGEDVTVVYNGAALEQAGLSQEDLEAERKSHAVPIEQVLAGKPHVRNSTLTADLLTMTLTTSHIEQDDTPVIVSAVIRLDALWNIALRARNFEVFVADSEGTLLAHSDRKRIAGRETVQLDDDVRSIAGQHNASLTREHFDGKEEMIGGFAGVSYGDLIAGAKVRRSAAYLAARDLLQDLMLMALGLLVVATLFGLFWAQRLTRPIERLAAATRRIAKGQFDVQIAVESSDEIGALAGSFNQMTLELKQREELLQDAQGQLVQSEKMAAFGQLGAGIAHEVKNPLAGILGCTQLALRKVECDTPLERNLRLIEKETRRCKEIIENLLRFARQEKALMKPIQINPVVHDAVSIIDHQLHMHKVEVLVDLADNLPLIHGNSNQLQQVLMNLIMNAQQAMEGEPGTVTVRTTVDTEGHVEVHVKDTGPGMTEDVRGRLFEPFFTTKPGGKGTGLGLSVSFGIIEEHGGEIEVESELGAGAEFHISLPILEEHQAQSDCKGA